MLFREPERIKALGVVSYLGSIATSGSRSVVLVTPQGFRVEGLDSAPPWTATAAIR